MRNLITLIENSQYGWSETTYEDFSKIFWETNREHWLDSDDYPSIPDLTHFFIWWEKGQPTVFAVASTNDEYGEVYNSEGSDSRNISQIPIVSNDYCQADLSYEQVADGDYSVAIKGLVEKLKVPFFSAIEKIKETIKFENGEDD